MCGISALYRCAGSFSFTASPDFGSYLPFPPKSPTLLHLVQPYALVNLHSVLGHIKQFRAYLGTLTASEVNAQIARDILIDLVDCSGINLDLLQPLLLELIEDAKILDGNSFKISPSCQELILSFCSSGRFSKCSGIMHAHIRDRIITTNSHSEADELLRNR